MQRSKPLWRTGPLGTTCRRAQRIDKQEGKTEVAWCTWKSAGEWWSGRSNPTVHSQPPSLMIKRKTNRASPIAAISCRQLELGTIRSIYPSAPFQPEEPPPFHTLPTTDALRGTLLGVCRCVYLHPGPPTKPSGCRTRSAASREFTWVSWETRQNVDPTWLLLELIGSTGFTLLRRQYLNRAPF